MMDADKEKATVKMAKNKEQTKVSDDILADPIDRALDEFSLRDELAGLDRTSMTLRKKELAKKYGVTPRDIEECWKDLTKSEGDSTNKKTPSERVLESLSVNDPKEPWDDDVEIGELIKETANTIKDFIVFKSDAQAYACALWVIASWFVDYVKFAPYILISAPMKQCGKSQLLKVLSLLSRRPLLSSNISTSVLFRLIELGHPTVFIDEVDTFLKENPELIGVINAGIEKDGAKAYRNEKQADGAFIPTPFDCFAFKALSGISAKNISETITDRAIVIELQRKKIDEIKKKLRETSPEHWIDLKRKYLKACIQYGEEVQKAKPTIPNFLSDRDGDKWSSLFALADLATSESVGEYFRKASRELKFKDDGLVSASYELLNDIREILDKPEYKGAIHIATKDLITSLTSDDEMSWGTWNRGNPLTPRQLSKRLKEFDISPSKFREYGEELRGYEVKDFKEAFTRYLSEVEA